jgi:hypothetical protein
LADAAPGSCSGPVWPQAENTTAGSAANVIIKSLRMGKWRRRAYTAKRFLENKAYFISFPWENTAHTWAGS